MTVIILDIDVNMEFLWLFTALLAGRMWIWIGEWRVESLYQERDLRMRTYFRVLAGLVLSLIFEMFMLSYIFRDTQQLDEARLVTMFSFEHAFLLISATSTTLSAFSLLEETSLKTPVQSIPGPPSADLMVAGGIVTSTATDARTEK
jgi:hypothetical protein